MQVIPFQSHNWLPSDFLLYEAGGNRSTEYSQIGAKDDISAIGAWLTATASRSPRTLSNYKKEVTRLLFWCANYAHKPISALQYEDLMRYRIWLIEPPVECIGQASTAAPMTEGWTPLRGGLSPISVSQTFTVLRAMFSWLVDMNYFKGNPAIPIMRAVARPKREKFRAPIRKETVERLFSEIDSLPIETDRVVAGWVFRLLLATGIRISEAISIKKLDLYKDKNLWFIRVIGKGNKERQVVFPVGLFPYYEKAREVAGMNKPEFYQVNQAMVFTSAYRKSPGEPIVRQTLHAWIKKILKQVAENIEAPSMKEEVIAIHAHLFRHTAATNWIANGVNLAEARDNLGHQGLETLGIYVHPDMSDRHNAISCATKI